MAACIGNLIGLDFPNLLLLMRVLGLIAFTAVVAYAIRVSPTLKWAFVLIAMLPVSIYNRSVLSADGAALACALMITALCFSAVQRHGCSADGCDFPRRDHQCRSASRGRRDGGDLRIIALGRYKLPSAVGSTLVGAVTHPSPTWSSVLSRVHPCSLLRGVRLAQSSRIDGLPLPHCFAARLRREIGQKGCRRLVQVTTVSAQAVLRSGRDLVPLHSDYDSLV